MRCRLASQASLFSQQFFPNLIAGPFMTAYMPSSTTLPGVPSWPLWLLPRGER